VALFSIFGNETKFYKVHLFGKTISSHLICFGVHIVEFFVYYIVIIKFVILGFLLMPEVLMLFS
jgi:hypothetical protein